MARLIAFAILIPWLVGPSLQAVAEPPPRHLVLAIDLVEHLDLKHTHYEHGPGTVVWDKTREAKVDCSGFLDALLQRSYSYDAAQFKKWLGASRPTARRYHNAIAEGKGFEQVAKLTDARPGDILAIKYKQPENTNTGHVMLVAGPILAMEPAEPRIAGTRQWEVPVIDSSMSGHGKTDTRHGKGEMGKDHTGVGRGVIRLYTDTAGKVAGYTWSSYAKSKFQPPDEHHLIIGRLRPDFKPE